MKRKMTRLALGLKLGMRAPGTPSTGGASALASDSPIRLAKLSMPKPLPILHNASRRESGGRAGKCNIVVVPFFLVHKLKFVGAEQHARVFAPGRGRLARDLISRRLRMGLQKVQPGFCFRFG